VRSRSPAVIDAFIRFATIEAAALVDANVGIVLSLARELLGHRSLDADQIAEIVEKAKLALIEARVPARSLTQYRHSNYSEVICFAIFREVLLPCLHWTKR
jgi:hypothetical protein